jgi:hypothetical protein
VVVYETPRIEQEQQGVVEDVCKDREHTLRLASLHKREARKMISGTMVEGLIDDPAELSDLAIEVLSEPEGGFEAAKNARLYYEAIRDVYDADAGATISSDGVYWLLDNAPRVALDYALAQQGGDDDEEVDWEASDERVRALEEALAARLGDALHSAGEMRAHLEWLAKEAGIVDDHAPDGTVAYTSGEGLLEKVHTAALYKLEAAEERARNIERHIIEKRRAHILPNAEELQKIARYEAHLSREMFRSLHELEALQTRRIGGAAPLGRLDVSS